MLHDSGPIHHLQQPLELPCGAILKNRLAKSPMSDSLGDGAGNPTGAQIRLYERWAEGGVALSIVGEVQGDPRFPEKPGNLVLGTHSNETLLRRLTGRATINGAHLWAQIGHAGALSHRPVSQPKGPSALNTGGLECDGMSVEEVRDLPGMYAKAASHAKRVEFSGVQIHAGHGFLLSQFLSPLFNRRNDAYGGPIEARCRVVVDIVNEVRNAVGPSFPVGIRINSTDKLESGLTEHDALEIVRLLDTSSIDLIDISGGTYFPGATAHSAGRRRGPYFLDFARRAREITDTPLMLTGGFKRREEVVDAVRSGAVDLVGMARALALDPALPSNWFQENGPDPEFPEFDSPPPGGVTAWYTMLLTALGEDRQHAFDMDIPSALQGYEDRDAQRCLTWRRQFSP